MDIYFTVELFGRRQRVCVSKYAAVAVVGHVLCGIFAGLETALSVDCVRFQYCGKIVLRKFLQLPQDCCIDVFHYLCAFSCSEFTLEPCGEQSGRDGHKQKEHKKAGVCTNGDYDYQYRPED